MLYAWESRDERRPAVEVLEEFLVERRIARESRPYLGTLVETVDEHRESIDGALERALTNWRLERLSAIDRNILRIGAAELMFVDDVPPRVSIQEAIILAEKYGTAESPRFVNGVLDALANEGRGAPGAGGREAEG